MRRNYFSFLMILLLTCAPFVAKAQFPDVFAVNPNYDAISYVADKGIVQGYPNGNFEPYDVINRAEFVKILMKTMYSDEEISACTGSSFSDVAADSWYAPYVCLAKEKGVVDGYSDKTFGPEIQINFAEAAKVLRNTLLANEKIVPAKDYDEWYGVYVDALSQKGAIPVSIYGFEAPVTRGEMATMIYRLDAKLDMLPSLTIDEMNDLKLIDKYYYFVSAHKFVDAYAMKLYPEMSFENFEQMYKDFPHSNIYNFTKTADHTYEFVVMTFPNIDATAEHTYSERYMVEMKVVGDKLQTVSSDKLTYQLLEELYDGSAIQWFDGVYKISAQENWKNVPQKEFSTKDGISTIVKNLAESSSRRYLTYQVNDWEFAGVGLYDLKTHTEPSELFQGVSVYGFSNDEKYFYFCSESGMSGGELFILDLPGFVRHDLDRGSMGGEVRSKWISGCGPFDKETNVLHYELTDNNTGKAEKGSYQM